MSAVNYRGKYGIGIRVNAFVEERKPTLGKRKESNRGRRGERDKEEKKELR